MVVTIFLIMWQLLNDPNELQWIEKKDKSRSEPKSVSLMNR